MQVYVRSCKTKSLSHLACLIGLNVFQLCMHVYALSLHIECFRRMLLCGCVLHIACVRGMLLHVCVYMCECAYMCMRVAQVRRSASPRGGSIPPVVKRKFRMRQQVQMTTPAGCWVASAICFCSMCLGVYHRVLSGEK